MNPQDIREALDAKPFTSFRLHLSDGSSFDVKHPDFIWVLRTRVVIAVPDEKEQGLIDHLQQCAMLHITRLEEVAASSTTT